MCQRNQRFKTCATKRLTNLQPFTFDAISNSQFAGSTGSVICRVPHSSSVIYRVLRPGSVIRGVLHSRSVIYCVLRSGSVICRVLHYGSRKPILYNETVGPTK